MIPPQGPLPPRRRRGNRGGAVAAADAALRRGSGPLKDEMAQWIAANKDKVRGKMVLIGKAAVIPVNFEPPAKRRPTIR